MCGCVSFVGINETPGTVRIRVLDANTNKAINNANCEAQIGYNGVKFKFHEAITLKRLPNSRIVKVTCNLNKEKTYDVKAISRTINTDMDVFIAEDKK